MAQDVFIGHVKEVGDPAQFGVGHFRGPLAVNDASVDLDPRSNVQTCSLFTQCTQVGTWLINALVLDAKDEEGGEEGDGQQQDWDQCRQHARDGLGRRWRVTLDNHKYVS